MSSARVGLIYAKSTTGSGFPKHTLHIGPTLYFKEDFDQWFSIKIGVETSNSGQNWALAELSFQCWFPLPTKRRCQRLWSNDWEGIRDNLGYSVWINQTFRSAGYAMVVAFVKNDWHPDKIICWPIVQCFLLLRDRSPELYHSWA